MITEYELGQALNELADLAPDECGPIAVRPSGGHRRPGAVAAAAIAAAVIAAGAVAIPSVLTHHQRDIEQPVTGASKIAPDLRARLTSIARAAAAANGDTGARAETVSTTYRRLAERDPARYLMLAAPPHRTAGLTAPLMGPLWVIQLYGHFDGGNTVLETFVDGTSLRELAGTGTTDPEHDAQHEMEMLGPVVQLF